jgi:hypothetical protein
MVFQDGESCIAGGVRQGDPLSPMLFLFSMEPLHKLFRRAQEMGLLSNLSKGCDDFRVSLYADDVAVFIRPSEHDLCITTNILNIFHEASGLATNMNKTEFYPIQCANTDLSFLTNSNRTVSNFPFTYLGLPLHYRKTTRSMLQPVIQNIGNKLYG